MFDQKRVQSIESTNEAIIALVSDIVSTGIGKKCKVVFVATQNLELRNLMREHSEIKPPFASVSFSDFNRNRTIVNQHTALKNGINLSKSEDFANKFYGIPIDVNFNIQIVLNNIEDVLKLITHWMRNPQVKYDLQGDEFSMKVRFELSESITFPEQDLENPGNFFKLQSTIKTIIFVGGMEETALIKKVTYSANPINSPIVDEVQKVGKPVEIVPAGAIVIQGPQGVKGDEGEAPTYTHTQAQASNIWTINHNLGFRPDVAILNAGQMEVDGAITHISENITVIYFSSAMTGTARLT
jgi:hypothetical protein